MRVVTSASILSTEGNLCVSGGITTEKDEKCDTRQRDRAPHVLHETALGRIFN